MSRRNDPSLLDDALELFKLTPTWFGPPAAVTAFLLIRYLVPHLIPKPTPGTVDPHALYRSLLHVAAWFVAAILLLAWIAAELWKLKNRRLLNSQRDVHSLRSLSWQDFERLVSEAYRRQGYLAEVTGQLRNDGGVDIILHRAGHRTLVQCKHWRAWKVGVAPVRELLGVLTHQRAPRGILVTSGRFTKEARAFASTTPQLELIEGHQLASMIHQVQSHPSPIPASPSPRVPASKLSPSPPPPLTPSPPTCPQCGSPMLRRTARRGPTPGSQFWGCPRYPTCKATRP